MAQEIQREGAYYYDLYPTEEDLMGETDVHHRLISYLEQVLEWLFHGQVCTVYANLNFYRTSNRKEYPLVPDLAVIKGVDLRWITSWKEGRTGPTPQVVFEIASEKTWENDLEDKPTQYAQMGVKEDFAYDPNQPALSRHTLRRLWGWQLDRERGQMREMPLHPDGHLWSSYLESYLVPDGKYLRLYDTHWQLRLTRAEAEAQRAEMEAEARRAETRRADAEARRAAMEAETRQAAERQAEKEAKRAEMLAQKLRSLGIDPDLL